MVNFLLRLEGLAVFIAALFFYRYMNGDWWLFAALLLAPDASMVGYFINKKLGAIIYNSVHNYILAIILVLTAFASKEIIFLHLGIILAAHVGMDHMLGYGLKYKSNFKDTHLQKV